MKKYIAVILALAIALSAAPAALAESGAPVKRAVFLQELASELDISPVLYENAFDDVAASDSFADILQGALHSGVVEEGGLFYPNSFITREEAADMTVRALRAACVGLSESAEPVFFRDWRDISADKTESVEIAFANRLIDFEEMFYPQRNATEEYCASLIGRAKRLRDELPVHVGDGSADADINTVRDYLRENTNEKAQSLYDEAMTRFIMNNSQSEVDRAYELIAMARGLIYDKRTSFLTGSYWYDDNGGLIQAHGGGILYDEKSGKYYWYGEAREPSTVPENLKSYASMGWRIGVACYSSEDLYNWRYEGLALEMIEGENLSYPQSDIRVGEVLERPKVIYNEKTGKYVMWMHIDNGWYGYSRAGVAVSDSAEGPFEYLGSCRPGGKMSRDMTVFVDDDGAAYLYFSTDENGCLACVRLSEDYLSCEDEATYCIWWQWREAPAVFKYKDTYYMITSGCTGWDPNAADYATAPSPKGPWTQHGSPCVGEGADITFGGQSAWVLPVDADSGKFIFIADIWRPADHKESGYIWLPIQINTDGSLRIEWVDEWKIGDLGYNIDTVQYTKTAVFGKDSVKLPLSTAVSVNGEKKRTPIMWSKEGFSADMPGHYKIDGTLPELGGAPVEAEVFAVPDNLIYFASCGGSEDGDFAAIRQMREINNSVPDKVFGRDTVTGLNWGYTADHSTGTRTDSDMYYSVRYDYSEGGEESVGTGLTYKFEVSEGKKYNVYAGICDPWRAEDRVIDVSVNGQTASFNTFDGPAAFCVTNVSPEEGYISVSAVRNEKTLAPSLDPLLSWIMISVGDGGESVVSGVRETEAIESDAEIESGKTYILTNAETGKALSAENGAVTSGGSDKYWIIRRESDGYYTVRNAISGLCLGVEGDRAVLCQPSSGGAVRFNITKARSGVHISPKKRGGFLEDSFNGIIASDDEWGRRVEWTLTVSEAPQEAEDAAVYRTIRSVKTGKAVTYGENAPLGVYAYDMSASQGWSFKKTYFGSYIISSASAAVSIDVPNGRTDDGLAMVVYQTIENINQRWFLEKDEKENYLFRSEASGLYLTVENGKLVQRRRDEGADQSFVIK